MFVYVYIIPLNTDKLPLEQTYEALERALNHKSECLKVMVYPNGEPQSRENPAVNLAEKET